MVSQPSSWDPLVSVLSATKLGRFELWSSALNSNSVYSFKHFPRPRVKYFKMGNLFSHLKNTYIERIIKGNV